MASAFALAWRASRWTLLGHAAVTTVAGLLPVVVAWLTKLILDGLVAGHPRGELLGLAAALAGAGVLIAAIPHLDRFLREELTRRIQLTGIDSLYRAVGRFTGLRPFEDPDFHDRLRLARDSGGHAPSDFVGSVIGGVRGLVTGVGFVFALLLMSPPMTAAVLLTAVPAILAERRLARGRASMMWDISPGMRRELFYSLLLGEVRAAKEVRVFGLGSYLRGKMLAERRAANRARRRMDRRELSTQGGLALLLSGVAGAGLLWAIHAAAQGTLSVGDVSMFIAAVASAQGAVSQVVSYYAVGRQSLLMFDHFLTVLRAEPDLPVSDSPVSVPPLREGIEFRDVWFRYTPDHPWVLRGVNLTISHGRSVALVGANGAGKSTIVKLLCRFYDPSRGAILWDGVDLRDMDPEQLRARLGAVFQDFMEYDLTAAENIALGDLEAGEDPVRVEAAARLAGVHDTLADLPHGYDTLLSRMFHPTPAEPGADTEPEGDPQVGVALSTGQWQRLALARALLRDHRDLLILDEPSSGLDAEAEAELHMALRRRRVGRTSLLISHRLGAIRDADRIAVIKDGRVAEEGPHEDLMRLNGHYARLFDLQARGYRDDALESLAEQGDHL